MYLKVRRFLIALVYGYKAFQHKRHDLKERQDVMDKRVFRPKGKGELWIRIKGEV